MVQEIRAHALANYGVNGWDYVVEAWTDADLVEVIERAGATSVDQAIAAVGKCVGANAQMDDEYRADAKTHAETYVDAAPDHAATSDSCDGCGVEGVYYEGLCYPCQCDYHALGEYDMDGDGWRVI